MEDDFLSTPEYKAKKRKAFIDSLNPGVWYSVKEIEPEQGDFLKVIGFSSEWIDEDFNPDGTRECFINGNLGWTSARWIDYQDCYAEDNDTVPTHFMIVPSTLSLQDK